VVFVDNDSINDAAFHFSVEEFFTRYSRRKEPVLMLWQTEKTVMLGNNQVVRAEVDVDYANKSEIQIVRRSSGGGAIFTDLGTVLYTVIEPLENEAKIHREKVASTIITAIKKMGVPAKREGRNDILVEGRKISGFAQYTSGNHICTHGSLLFDADLETLSKVLIANEEKLIPKGIASIRSRVTNIKPYIKETPTTSEFISMLKKELLTGKIFSLFEPGEDDLKSIDRIKSEKYANRDWNYRL